MITSSQKRKIINEIMQRYSNHDISYLEVSFNDLTYLADLEYYPIQFTIVIDEVKKSYMTKFIPAQLKQFFDKDSRALTEDEKELANEGGKIAAIKSIRNRIGCDLMSAHAMVSDYING